MKRTLCILAVSVALAQICGAIAYGDDEDVDVSEGKMDRVPRNATADHPMTRDFKNPWVVKAERRYALDWCYHWAEACGQQAADAFCESKHLNRGAFYFEQKPAVSPTWVAGDERVCEGSCDSFTIIKCRQ